MNKLYKEYEIRLVGFNDYLKIRIYKTEDSMQRAIRRFSQEKLNNHKDTFEDYIGICCPTPSTYNNLFESESSSLMYATLFLNEEWMKVEYVVHETLHAALVHERRIVNFCMDYGDKWSLNEERMVQYHTDIFSKTWSTLVSNGHVKQL